MELRVYPDHDSLSTAAAGMIIDCVLKKPDSLLCFATGDTTKLTYRILAEKAKRNGVDFSKCTIVGLDEWLGIPPTTSGTCHHFLHKYLFEPLNIDPSQVYLFDAMTSDPEIECSRMNDFISQQGNIDFMIVGVGMNGHIGFNEPGTDVNLAAHVATLDETTRTVAKKYFEQEVHVSQGITLGLKQVMDAATVLMMANGKKKAPVIKRAIENQIGPGFPASLIRLHKKALLMIDEEAASELQRTSYKWDN